MKKFAPFIIGISVGAVIAICGFYLVYTFSEIVFTILLTTIITFTLIVSVLYFKKDTIIQKFQNNITIPVNQITEESNKLIDGISAKDKEQIKSSSNILISTLSNKYIDYASNLWLVRMTMALLVTFGAIFGSYILYQQNKLIEKQNKFFQEQNVQIANQFERQLTFQQNSTKAELHKYLFETEEVESNDHIGILLKQKNIDVNRKVAKNYPLTRINSLKSLISINSPNDNNPMNLSGSLLQDLDLRFIKFKNIELYDANLSESAFTYYNLPKHLQKINFRQSAIMDSSKIDHFARNELYFNSCLFFQTEFYPVKLKKPSFENCIFSRIHWGGKNSVFSRVFIEDAEFIDCLFSTFPFDKVSIDGANFDNCTMDSICLSKFSKLKNIEFVDCKFEDGSIEIGELVEVDSLRFYNFESMEDISHLKSIFKLVGDENDFFERHKIEFVVYEDSKSMLITNKIKLDLPIQFNDTR